MSRKGAIELSINFFVILIISLVVFGMGLTLFWKIYQSGEEQLSQVSRSVEDRIIRQLHGGSKVSVVPRALELQRKDEYVVGVGINNVETSTIVFKVFLKRGLFVMDDGTTCNFNPDIQAGEEDCETIMDDPIPPLEILGNATEIRVEPNKQEIANILIKAGSKAISGEYIVNICVCHDDNCVNYESCVPPAGEPYDTNYPVSKVRVKVL